VRGAVASVSIPNTSHKALARQAASASLVLLKNNTNVLPLSPQTPHIRVAGSAADNVGKQMGAWTVEWQGIDGHVPVGATSILAALKERVGAGVRVEFSEAGEFAPESNKAPIGVAVVGEKPYAEGWGDTEYPTLSAEDRNAIKNLQTAAERVVVIIISGRPLLIADEVDSFDALVAAWLPGSEGAGVIDGVFGDTPFTGTLPVPWPHHSEQLPIAPSGDTADGTPVLFVRGFGIAN